MEFLKVIKTGEAVEGFPPAEEMAQKYPYELDNFQQHAVAAIHREENVLVTAKTGSGKTLVGEYQIAYSLKKGGRVFYTTPIKSLSNQKFHDLKEMFPSVGIVTGDIKFQPDAAVVVMTTLGRYSVGGDQRQGFRLNFASLQHLQTWSSPVQRCAHPG